MRSVGILTLGCKVNTYESEYIINLLKENNYEIKSLEVFFASTGNHQEIDNIEMSLAELKRYIEGHQKYDALAKSQVLDFLFHHLPKNSRLKTENIF